MKTILTSVDTGVRFLAAASHTIRATRPFPVYRTSTKVSISSESDEIGAHTMRERNFEDFRRLWDTAVHNAIKVLIHVFGEELSQQCARPWNELGWLQHHCVA